MARTIRSEAWANAALADTPRLPRSRPYRTGRPAPIRWGLCLALAVAGSLPILALSML